MGVACIRLIRSGRVSLQSRGGCGRSSEARRSLWPGCAGGKAAPHGGRSGRHPRPPRRGPSGWRCRRPPGPGRQDHRIGLRGPDMGQVGLARALGSDQQSLRPGQSCQPSTVCRASALDGARKKCARVSASGLGRSKASCRITRQSPSCGGGRASALGGHSVTRAIVQGPSCPGREGSPGTARSRSGSGRRWRRRRHGDQHADKAEDGAEGRQREQKPDRCRPTDLPTRRGVRMLPSTNWPTAKIAAMIPICTSRPRTGTAQGQWPRRPRPASRRKE